MSVDEEKDHEAQPAAPTSPPTQQSITANPTAADPPPDGGLHAWLQVLVGHLTVFNSFGQINSFGIYQSHYTSTFALSPSTISWIGSLQILLIYGVGALSGRALDAGHFRPTLALGLALQVLGTFATSAAEGAYWRLLLAQGVCQGLGMGLAFCPAVANAATYFARRRVVAISCVACGGATGGMVFPAIAQTLLGRVGFAWTVRVIGFVVLFNAAVILALARTRGQRVAVVGDGGGAPLIDWAAFREIPYLLYCVSMFFAFWGIWVAYYYVRAYARDILDFSDKDSFNLILIINGVGVPGRLVPAIIADRFFGPVNVFIPVIFVAGICLFCWAAVSSPAGMIAFVVFYGFFGAGTQSLLQAALASLNTDIKKAGVRIGMGFSVVGLASLTGSPIGGALLEQKGGQYLYAQVFAGGTMVIGSLILVAARISKTGFILRERM
ncbi:major facilitator superfamily domain-containing protein [Macrophomina phaseolina]|uniref:Major facilitator superfamily domain-containing protein n=1 Tax=Macrophomina phaseolina TaxID=35725 RepID=A0ABQ8GU24_9PEZI|nr:major facilitator superfamily domain-containing protein [Macrophomina phaseolina]